MDISPFIAPAVTVVIAIVGGYFAITNAITRVVQAMRVDVARLETKVDDLRRDVEKHNSVVERTIKLEQSVGAAWHSIDELKDRDDKIESMIGK